MQPDFTKIIVIIILSIIFIPGCRKKNLPPHNPYTPDGPSSGFTDNAYSFSSLANDPNGDSVTIRFEWGNDDTSDWASVEGGWVITGEPVTMLYSWSDPDTYYIRSQAKDKSENTSEWSLAHCVIIEIQEQIPNEPPVPSIPSGPSTGNVDYSYRFSSSAIDPEGYSVAIRFDWGDDDTSDWSAWTRTGDSVFMTHAWLLPDTYYLRFQAMDTFGMTSDWSEPHSIGITLVEWICATPSAQWSPRESHASVIFDNKMWVIGGHDCPDEVWSSPDGVNWTCVTDSAGFRERDDHRAVVFDDKIWVIAGSHGYPRNDVWCSSNGVNWTCVTNSAQWSPRYDHSSVVFDNKLWVIGGKGRNTLLNDVWYSTDGVNWICATESAPWRPRQNHTSVVFDNKMWVMGGEVLRYCLNDVWFSTNGIDWFFGSGVQWTPRYWHTSVVFDNKIWVLGGHRGGAGKDDVWYSMDGFYWIEEFPRRRFDERGDHTAVVFDNKIWVLGGIGRAGTLLNDIWYRVVTYSK